jgi:DeoR family transcriptional regulator, fructose operon transcriptional repressor
VSYLLAVKRKKQIIEFVTQQKMASVLQLAEKFEVHEATIRRDLAEIEKEGHLRRIHGGVVLEEDVLSEPSFSERSTERIKEKSEIGKLAASFVKKGDNIILDSGTTTLQIARNITHLTNITVITNDINIAGELRNCKGIKVIVTGGVLWHESYMLNGLITDDMLGNVHVHKAFIGTPAIHTKHGLTHFNEQLVSAKQGMIKAAKEVIVVADHTKIGGVSLHTVSHIDDIDMLITGNEVSQSQIAKFQEASIEVVIAQEKDARHT